MRSRLAVYFGLPLALLGCSFHYDLVVVEMNGRITFKPKDDKSTGCLTSLKVTADNGEIAWEVDAGRYIPPPCDDKFPVTYGAVPTGMSEKVKAAPLRAGVRYRVEAWDGDSYSGAFRFRPGIIIQNEEEPA